MPLPASAIWYPSVPGSASGARPSWPFWLLLAVFAGLAVAAIRTITLDHAFGIATHSRALYVDGGFYSDAAQNMVNFGRWGFPYDFSHWAGAPLLALLQTLVFAISGANLEAARLISVFASLISALAFYALARMGLRPVAAAALTVAGVVTFNYVAHARSALADPLAVCLAMLALLAYARLRPAPLAIAVSIGFAFLAMLAKVYFIFTLAAVTALWLVELWLRPLCTGVAVRRPARLMLGLSLAAVGAACALYLLWFGERFAAYQTINATNIPLLDPAYLTASFVESIRMLPFNTKTQVFLLIIVATSLAAIVALAPAQTRRALLTRGAALSRGEIALLAWLAVGLMAIGVLQVEKPHYHFFAILPLAVAAAVGLKLVLPPRRHTAAIAAMAVLHILFQAQYYQAWAQRSDPTALYDASQAAVAEILQRSSADMIPVLGEYAAQLGLFSDRIFSLDARWTVGYALCDRMAHWRPRFHVNIVWPGSVSQGELSSAAACHQVLRTEEIARYTVFAPWQDELVLSRIYYRDS